MGCCGIWLVCGEYMLIMVCLMFNKLEIVYV